MGKIRFAVVGLGSRGKYMFNLACDNFTQFQAVALCDLDDSLWTFKADANDRSLAEKYSEALFYTDYDKMLAEVPLDAVLVETPAHIHAEFCLKALERGIAVLSDVPFVASIAEGEQLWQCIEETGSLFMAGANPNEWGFVEALVDLYDKGFLGELSFLEAEYIHDVRHLWERTPWRSKGDFKPITYCTHSLGPLLRILREDLRYVSCLGSGSKICPDDPKRQDVMTAHFRTENNVVLRLMTSFINNYPHSGHNYRVFGTEGYFERFAAKGKIPATTFFSSNKLYATKALTELPIAEARHDIVGSAGKGHGGADYALVKHFLQALRKERPAIDLKEGLRMTLPGIYAAKSAELDGQIVEIKYPWD